MSLVNSPSYEFIGEDYSQFTKVFVNYIFYQILNEFKLFIELNMLR